MEDPHAEKSPTRSAMMPWQIVVMTVSLSVLLTAALIALLMDVSHRAGYAEGLFVRQQVQVEEGVAVVGEAATEMKCFTGCPGEVDR